MFKPHRIFAIKNQAIGTPEWYFQAREGNIGPYESKALAEIMQKKFTEICAELGRHGGRKQGSKSSSDAPNLHYFLHYELKGDAQRY